MDAPLTYKEFTGTYEYDAEAGIYHGEVTGLKDIVTFQGRDLDELRQAFQDSVDDYLEFCQQGG